VAEYKVLHELPHGSIEALAKVCQTCGAVVINSRLHDTWHEITEGKRQ
jgi:hypothetical protein